MPPTILERIGRLTEGERLRLMADFQNTVDRHAVAVRTDSERMMLGYVPRYLAQDVWSLVQKCEPGFIELFVDRVNLDAPLQNRLLCRMEACWPNGFRPCTGEEFMPIPANVPAQCGP